MTFHFFRNHTAWSSRHTGIIRPQTGSTSCPTMSCDRHPTIKQTGASNSHLVSSYIRTRGLLSYISPHQIARSGIIRQANSHLPHRYIFSFSFLASHVTAGPLDSAQPTLHGKICQFFNIPVSYSPYLFYPFSFFLFFITASVPRGTRTYLIFSERMRHFDNPLWEAPVSSNIFSHPSIILPHYHYSPR